MWNFYNIAFFFDCCATWQSEFCVGDVYYIVGVADPVISL